MTQKKLALITVFIAMPALVVGVGTVTAQSSPDCSAIPYNGEGTVDSPFQVSTLDQLVCMDEDHQEVSGFNAAPNSDYVLVSDIDATETSQWNNGKGMEPLDFFFAEGSVDGNGHTVTGVTVTSSGGNQLGLFASVDSEVSVTNISVEDADITGNENSFKVGVLVGQLEGIVKNSHVSGNINGEVNEAGGLVGENTGSISNSSADVNINSGKFDLGGLVGKISGGEIMYSSASGEVTGQNKIGGLVGYSDEGKISTSFASGDVTASETGVVGGLVGENEGVESDESSEESTITDSYATGDVDSSGFTGAAGGLVGRNNGNIAKINRSYAVGKIVGDGDTGGLIGDNQQGPITNSYWDSETTGQSSSSGGTELTTEEMTGTAAESNMQGFDFTDTWETVSGDYPVLTGESEESDSEGSLSPNNPFGDSSGNPVDRGTVINRIVEWNLDENGEINGTQYTRSELINYIVEWNLESG